MTDVIVNVLERGGAFFLAGFIVVIVWLVWKENC
jgi:hypothetical protein